jgi:16S rRNA (cytosine1402-N4)-methyltransferase
MPSSPSEVDFFHRPALLDECLDYLELAPGSIVVDGTVGGGGHAEAILERTAPDGALIGLDRDAEAIETASKRLARFGDRVTLVRESFRNLDTALAGIGVGQVDGVLFDLGVSSHQLDVAGRGFRFGAETADETPLDMRMDASSGSSAADLLRTASPDEIESWFRDYGDVRGARRLARAIVEARRESPLRSAADLRAVIRAAGIGRGRRHDPATLVFQALRIATNDELGALADGIESGIEALRAGGRFVVLSYHSAEDRIVKNRFRDAVKGCTCPPRTPVCICGGVVRLRVLTRKPIEAGADEIRRNPRARSARLRAAERVAEAL